MPNYLCRCSFVGTGYRGFQVQVQDNTVCHKLQDAIQKVFLERYDVKGCSRTDSGVHANEFYFNFHAQKPYTGQCLYRALNSFLPPDIRVNFAKEVPEEFHARYDSLGKEYIYLMHIAPTNDPFYEGRAFWQRRQPNVQLLASQAQDFVGQYDFSSFCGKRSDVEDKVRTLSAFDVWQWGDNILFRVRGDGFLYRQVRICVGTLLQIERGLLPVGCIPEILKTKKRANAGWTAQPEGLYLNRVFYEPELGLPTFAPNPLFLGGNSQPDAHWEVQ